MSDSDPYADRRRLTFEQAEGVEPLPTQLQLKELSPELRARLWAAVHHSIRADVTYDSMGGAPSYLKGNWREILLDHHVVREHLMIDEYNHSERVLVGKFKELFLRSDYTKVFGFLQFVLRHQKRPYQFSKQVDYALAASRAAYRILDERTIIPVGSDAERLTLQRAFADLATSEFRGARSHLHTAGSDLTAGDYAASIRESINAVESVARVLESSGKLSEALGKLEHSAAIHGGLRKGFLAIYGYTSDERGIRHPLLEDNQAKVDEVDALFMIGACASFVSYMINKARLAGLIGKK